MSNDNKIYKSVILTRTLNNAFLIPNLEVVMGSISASRDVGIKRVGQSIASFRTLFVEGGGI